MPLPDTLQTKLEDSQPTHITSPRLLLLVCGLSGAGHSSAHHHLGDLGFMAVDNLPLGMVDHFLEHIKTSSDKRHEKISLLLQVGSHEGVEAYTEQIRILKETGGITTILLYLDADRPTILKRYSETRRPHPRFDPVLDQTLSDTLEREMLLMYPLRAAADRVIDTSLLSIHEFRRELTKFVSTISLETKPAIRVNFLSFGFKHGAPRDCDLIIDVRFLQNPYFIEQLRPKSGLEDEVSAFVLQSADAQEFLTKYTDLLSFLIPRYTFEGKAYLNIGVGCTGGKHRSVAIAEALSALINVPNILVSAAHRDVKR
jgi:UPF0042 nucleotide-binding protein